MILGIGIDTVHIDRFNEYHLDPLGKMHKLFSRQEIDYCLSKERPAAHFASRFATREAFFKAYQAMLHHYNKDHPANLFTINKSIRVLHTPKGLPYIKANWAALLPEGVDIPQVHVSITHTDMIATSLVVLSNKKPFLDIPDHVRKRLL